MLLHFISLLDIGLDHRSRLEFTNVNSSMSTLSFSCMVLIQDIGQMPDPLLLTVPLALIPCSRKSCSEKITKLNLMCLWIKILDNMGARYSINLTICFTLVRFDLNWKPSSTKLNGFSLKYEHKIKYHKVVKKDKLSFFELI